MTNKVATALRAELAGQPAPLVMRDLSVLAYANGFTLWHYRVRPGQPAPENVDFSPAEDMMGVGDMVLISGDGHGQLMVVANVDPVALAKVV